MAKYVPRERKHRRLAKQQNAQTSFAQGSGDANASEVVPLTNSQKEERRRQLQEDLRAQQPETKVSAKKRKRLDKYIDTKLKKEENLDLLKKLAAQKVDTSLLQSAKKLGRVNETKRERFSRTLQEQRAGLPTDDAILYERRREQDAQGEDGEVESVLHEYQHNPSAAATALDPDPTSITPRGGLFGSGLKRPLETDESGRPVIKKRKRQKKSHPAKVDFAVTIPPAASDGSDTGTEGSADEWNGFDSDAESGASENEHEVESTSPDDAADSSDDAHSDESSEGDTESSAEGDFESDESNSTDRPARVSAFKAWADTQRNEAVGFTPSALPTDSQAVMANFKPRPVSPDPVATEIAASSQVQRGSYRPADAVVVTRSAMIQEARLKLPVVQDEQRIMEAVHSNPVTIVCGATGSGKTTQLPQILLENGYARKGMIGITQPRRVAATSVADRVKFELGPEHGKQVAHQVRYDSNVGRDTKIKFMTDGILLREISQDFALGKYSAIVIDEAHERSVNTDILIGMLVRIVPLRKTLSEEQPNNYLPLKLIIMSATLRVTDFLMNARLFRDVKPPIVEAEGRQYRVTEHFSRKTQRDYVAEMARKVTRGHRKLPPGDMLVFLTGQDEIQTVAKRLKEQLTMESASFQLSKSKQNPTSRPAPNDYLENEEAADGDSDEEITGLDGDDEDAEFAVETDPAATQGRGVLKPQILPLYAALPKAQQDKVFGQTPDGFRKIILATNVAETSLTIDGIRYVFDCGRSKEKQYDADTGVQEFKVDWISKASAAQRMGRAGRTGPGHCYRLYSSAIYEQYFQQHTLPEILRTPIEGTVLQLKNNGIENVVNFPYPTPPASEQLSKAERLLRNLGAIDKSTAGRVTDVGKELIKYPVNPRFGKMLFLGLRNNVLAHAIALVAGLAVGDLFIPAPQAPKQDDQEEHSDDPHDKGWSRNTMAAAAQTEANQRKQAYGRALKALTSQDEWSDAIKVLTAVGAHAQAELHGSTASICAELFLREKGMAEVQQLRRQLHNIVATHAKDSSSACTFPTTLAPPTPKEIAVLKQIVAAGYIDQVAVRGDLLSINTGRKPGKAIDVAYRTLLPSTAVVDHKADIYDQARQQSVFAHASSVLAHKTVSEMPDFIIYANLSRATAKTVSGNQRTRMHPLTPVTKKQLAALAEGTPLLDIGKPIGKIEELPGKKRRCWVSVSLRDPASVGSTGWPLPAWKVVQRKEGSDWVIERVLDKGEVKRRHLTAHDQHRTGLSW